MPPLDYQPDLRRRQQSVSRASWSVVQTGLITTALALFGVFVLASRINNVEAMDFYLPRGVPLGAAVVGAVAGAGYVAGSWWNGFRVRGWLLIAVLLLQVASFFGAHYAEFSTMDLVYSDTKDAVQFWNYFHYATTSMTLGGEPGGWTGEPLGLQGYFLRAFELAVFCLPVLATAVVLAGKPTCNSCRGTLRHRRLAAITASKVPQAVAAIQAFARSGDFRRLNQSLGVSPEPGTSFDNRREPVPTVPVDVDEAKPGEVELILFRCSVCGSGFVELVESAAEPAKPAGAMTVRVPVRPPAERIEVPAKYTDSFFASAHL